MARKLLDWWSTADLAWKKAKPHEFVSKVEELRRGGFPASSIPEAVSGGGRRTIDVDALEKGLSDGVSLESVLPPGALNPQFFRDKFDLLLDDYMWQYQTTLQSVVDACDELRILEHKVLGVMSLEEASRLLVSAEVGRDSKFECANCREIFKRTKNQRPRSGRCRACYEWRKNHAGEERPIERSVA